jgi:hypothetical protein
LMATRSTANPALVDPRPLVRSPLTCARSPCSSVPLGQPRGRVNLFPATDSG